MTNLLTRESKFSRFSRKTLLNAGIASLLYFVWTYFFVGFRSDHIFILAVCLSAYFAHPVSRKVFIALAVFIVYWLIYDSLRVIHNYEVNTVHIKDLYDAEKSLFGIWHGKELITPNEYFEINNSPFLDFLTGFFYLNWVPFPLFFAIWMLVKKNYNLFVRFSYAFVFTNIVGFVFYYLYPAAPPWYVAQHGFEFIENTPGSTAGLSRFDDLFNVNIFSSLYEKNSNVFAAMPSLHFAYPIILLYYAQKLKNITFNIICIIFVLGIWFAAVYTNHHYILDVLAGALCAVIGIIMFEKLIKIELIKKWFDSLLYQLKK